jgi:hypothetical protein
MEREYQARQELCAALLKASVVTGSDLASPQTANRTSGQRLFQLIRRWGQAKAELELSLANERRLAGVE